MSAVLDDYLNVLLQETTQPAAAAAVPVATPAVTPAPTPPRTVVPPIFDAEEAADVPAERWLSFRLGGQCYALQVSALQEVLSWQPLTRVPCAPTQVLGLIHRRGIVVPILDIRHQLGLGVAAPTPQGALVLLPEGFGIAVDGIADVFVPDEDTQPAPLVGNPMPSVRALARNAGETVILLDGTRLVTSH